MRSVFLPLFLAGCACPEPPSLTADTIRSGPDRQQICSTVQAYSNVDYVVVAEGEGIDTLSWDLPARANMWQSNDTGSVVSVHFADAGGDLCVTAHTTCDQGEDPESAPACLPIDLVEHFVHTQVPHVSAQPPISRNDPAGGVINDIGYHGLGSYNGNDVARDWWSFDWADLSWTQLEDFPGTGGRGYVSFVLKAQVHVVNRDEHYTYDPSAGWAAVPSPSLPMAPSWSFVLDDVAYISGPTAMPMLRFDEANMTWVSEGVSSLGGGFAYEQDGQARVADIAGALYSWSPGEDWTLVAPGSTCGAFPAVAVGMADGVVYAMGNVGTPPVVCALEGDTWAPVPVPREACGTTYPDVTAVGSVWSFSDRIAYLAITDSRGIVSNDLEVFLP